MTVLVLTQNHLDSARKLGIQKAEREIEKGYVEPLEVLWDDEEDELDLVLRVTTERFIDAEDHMEVLRAFEDGYTTEWGDYFAEAD